MTAGATCQGCGAALPPKTWQGRDQKWCSEACRKRTLYSRQCVDCGAVCNTDGRVARASERCLACARKRNHETREWTPETIIAAIRLWADEHGGVPPVATDWVTRASRDSFMHPYPATVLHEFGTWNAAISASGFDTFKPGHYGREGEDPAVVAETIRLYRMGLSCAAVGERMCVSAGAVASRLKTAGEPRRAGGWPRRSA